MSKEAGIGLNLCPERYISSMEKRIKFSFGKIGNKNWQVFVLVEKLGGESKSSAYRLKIETPTEIVRDELVHILNSEQLADIGLQYAELITAIL